MQINPISYNYNPSFNAKGITTLQSGKKVIIEVKNNPSAKNNITKISMELSGNPDLLEQYERTWFPSGVQYNTILQANYLNAFFEKLGVTDEFDKQNIKNVFNETYNNEILAANSTETLEKPSRPITRNDLYPSEYCP